MCCFGDDQPSAGMNHVRIRNLIRLSCAEVDSRNSHLLAHSQSQHGLTDRRKRVPSLSFHTYAGNMKDPFTRSLLLSLITNGSGFAPSSHTTFACVLLSGLFCSTLLLLTLNHFCVFLLLQANVVVSSSCGVFSYSTLFFCHHNSILIRRHFRGESTPRPGSGSRSGRSCLSERIE